jgi:hypothetical protein
VVYSYWWRVYINSCPTAKFRLLEKDAYPCSHVPLRINQQKAEKLSKKRALRDEGPDAVPRALAELGRDTIYDPE